MMRSLRARVTIATLVVTALALTVGALFLHSRLRSSLLDEIDRTITNRAFDVADGIDLTNELSNAAFPADGETFVGVIEGDGTLEIHNDHAPSAVQIIDALTGEDGLISVGQPLTAALPSLTLVEDANRVRVVAADLVTGDELVVVARSLAGVARTLDQARTAFAVAVPMLSLLAALAVWLIAGRALGPVEAMRRQVEEISAGDLGRRVAPGTSAEIGRLAATMNQMLERLELAQERQRRFAADAAHELRSPLTAMIAQLDVDSAHPGSAEWDRTASRLRSEAGRLQETVDDLLVLAATESAVPRSELVDLDDLVAGEIQSFAPVAGIDTTRVSAATVRGDARHLRRVVRNLLSNAVRHAAAAVAVEVGVVGSEAVIHVDDDGPGVPEGSRERVFERFVRLDEGRARDTGGSGLGLALVAEVVAAHGGRIEVTTSPLGGARFTIALPAA